ncbi:MAG: crossover junction endodeoxyribonuclease RuvC [Flavobacteriales bacterium]|nr:crossover junction endodeoxyribonuclease RuvC [Flavobacteriales bacterium]
MKREKIILGVDPGTTIMGYGLMCVSGKKTEMLNMGVIRLSKLETHSEKLERIFSRIAGIIDEFQPNEMAIEAPFFGKNVQSMLKLGRAQGVAIAAALSKNVPYIEYAPRRIKQAITGNGNASKEQVAAMLQNIFKIVEMPKEHDATDGLAVALCHHFSAGKVLGNGKSFTGWKAFVQDQKHRVKE